MFSIILELPQAQKKAVAKEMCNAMNASVIAYMQIHINQSPQGEQTFDKAIEEEFFKAEKDERLATALNFGTQLPTDYYALAEKTAKLRNWLEDVIMAESPTKWDLPFRLIDRIEWLLKRPDDTNIEKQKKEIAEFLHIPDTSKLKSDAELETASDKKRLQKAVPEMLRMIGVFEEDGVDPQGADELFDQLPTHVQYKLQVRLLDSIKNHYANAYLSVLNPGRRTRRDSAGELALIYPIMVDVHRNLEQFETLHAAELDAYTARGFDLPAIPAIPQPGEKGSVAISLTSKNKLDQLVAHFNQ